VTFEPAERAFEWTHFHDVAAQLLDVNDEAAWRCAVSRDYYAVFNRAKQVVATLDPQFTGKRGDGSHQAIWDAVRNLPRRQATTLARLGQNLMAKRKLADYELKIGGWQQRARQAHEEAARGLRQASELMQS
jgi:hypothetical protein